MVFVTGDCHADFRKFSSGEFPEQEEMTRDDIVIICGDFGLWHDDELERWWLNWLESKNFTLVFVDGNHENFDRLYSNEFEIVDFHGGKAHKIRENIYHLMRGYVFDFEGRKFFAFGGASSHDIDDGILDRDDYENDENFRSVIKKYQREGKMFRINHLSWWEQELSSQEEMDFGLKTLAEHGNKVDFIISHCCPQQVASLLSYGAFKPDVLTRYFDDVAINTEFDKWFFGHYHDNRRIKSKYVLLYDEIERVL